jgi:hypothetical protein
MWYSLIDLIATIRTTKMKIMRYISFYLAILCVPSTVSAKDIFSKYLEVVMTEFDAACSKDEKYEIVKRPFHRDYLGILTDVSDIDDAKLYGGVSLDPIKVTLKDNTKILNYNKANILVIAICKANVGIVRKLLTVVDDVNDPELTGWGYRQPFMPAHFALDPNYYLSSYRDSSIRDIITIIDMLASKGADFNMIIRHSYPGIYHNPPLTAGSLNNHNDLPTRLKLQARALVYGADPELRGSSFYAFPVTKDERGRYPTALYQAAFDSYLELNKAGVELNPVDSVKEIFRNIKTERMAALSELDI